MFYLICFVSAILLFAAVTAAWRGLSRGLSRQARWQQLTRFGIGSLVAAVPWAVAGTCPSAAAWIPVAVISAGWLALYPALDYATRRGSALEINNKMDFGAGLYILAALESLMFVCADTGWGGAAVLAVTGVALLLPLLFQAGYFCIYGGAVDSGVMQLVADTNVNEVIELSRGMSRWRLALLVVAVLLPVTAISVCAALAAADVSLWRRVAELVPLSFALWELLKPRKGALWRCGIVALWLDVRDYRRQLAAYTAGIARRRAGLNVSPRVPLPAAPSTVLLVIGESASRDYMSAFTDMDADTTPWMRGMAGQPARNFIFRDSWSCANQTVPSLQRALTEMNQYRDIAFDGACSIVDIARAMGYRVSWFSNQGHLGVADTAVSLIAESGHRAEWTSQHVGRVPYDEVLLDMLATVDPADHNFVVLHLKGSHFNFINRYPASATVWGRPGEQDDILNYRNSIRYTDTVLQRAFEYARDRLGLRAMIYCSDHATYPDKRRSPRFDGYGQFRIPLFVHLSDAYAADHPGVAAALAANRDRAFTNDLLYDLVCGILDISSDRYDPSASIASPSYRFCRRDMLTDLGSRSLAPD